MARHFKFLYVSLGSDSCSFLKKVRCNQITNTRPYYEETSAIAQQKGPFVSTWKSYKDDDIFSATVIHIYPSTGRIVVQDEHLPILYLAFFFLSFFSKLMRKCGGICDTNKSDLGSDFFSSSNALITF